MPAYTCASMPSAVVLSGNIPRFVDIEAGRMTMDMARVVPLLNRNTRAVVITPMYGFPVRMDSSASASVKFIEKSGIQVIRDCALGLGTQSEMNFSSVYPVSLYSFSIGKQISTGEGGMVVTDERKVYESLKNYRDRYLRPASLFMRVKRMLFFVSAWAGSSSALYPVTYYMARRTPLLDSLTKHYDPCRITVPKDISCKLDSSSGFLGQSQLERADSVLGKKRRVAERYLDAFRDVDGIVFPEFSQRASYSHFPGRLKNRAGFIEYMISRGIEIGTEIFDYVTPYLPVFRKYSSCRYPNSEELSKDVILFPIHHRLTDCQLNRVIEETKKWQLLNRTF